MTTRLFEHDPNFTTTSETPATRHGRWSPPLDFALTLLLIAVIAHCARSALGFL